MTDAVRAQLLTLAGYDVQVSSSSSRRSTRRRTSSSVPRAARRGTTRAPRRSTPPQARARNRPVPRAGASPTSSRPRHEHAALLRRRLGRARRAARRDREPRLALALRRVRRHVAARSARRGAFVAVRAPPPRRAAPFLPAAAAEAADEDERNGAPAPSPGRASAAPGWFAPSCRTSGASSTSISPARSRATSRSVSPATTCCSSSARTGSATGAAPGWASRCAWRSHRRAPADRLWQSSHVMRSSPATWSASLRACTTAGSGAATSTRLSGPTVRDGSTRPPSRPFLLRVPGAGGRARRLSRSRAGRFLGLSSGLYTPERRRLDDRPRR